MDLFNLHIPKGSTVPLVANLPHSGLFVPDDIAAQFTSEHLQALPNSDWHLDQLYQSLPDLGITVIQATHSRYVVDLNRQVKEPILVTFGLRSFLKKQLLENPFTKLSQAANTYRSASKNTMFVITKN
jgi:N-formylglutamate amidohydrolase